MCANAAEPVILDTDSGLFGDDGAALVMLLHSPSQISLKGIVVTPGNVWPAQGAEYTLHILDLARKPSVPFTWALSGRWFIRLVMKEKRSAAGARWRMRERPL